MTSFLKVISIVFILIGTQLATAEEIPLPKDAPGRSLLSILSQDIGTENVKDLRESLGRRLDELRNAQADLFRSELKNQNIISELRAKNAKELSEAAIARIDAELKIRADFGSQIAASESNRINAIRAIDANAVSVAAQRAADQANVLATQVATTAEALRSLVATTAATVATSQQQLGNTLSARLTTLEQMSYQQASQSKLQDPAFIALVNDVRALTAAQTNSVGRNEGSASIIAYMIAGGGMLIGAFSLIVTFSNRRRNEIIK